MLGLKSKKYVSIQDSNDFPDLDDDGEPTLKMAKPLPMPKNVVPKQSKKQQKPLFDESWVEKLGDPQDMMIGGVKVQLASNKVRPETSKPTQAKNQA